MELCLPTGTGTSVGVLGGMSQADTYAQPATPEPSL